MWLGRLCRTGAALLSGTCTHFRGPTCSLQQLQLFNDIRLTELTELVHHLRPETGAAREHVR
jgi:hypothetical protein